MIIIDLFAQRDAVAAKLREIQSPGQLDWLRSKGELIEIALPAPNPPAYHFRSTTGIETGFIIRDGMMIFLGDHTTLDAVEIEG